MTVNSTDLAQLLSATTVTASDNAPCFDGHVQYKEVTEAMGQSWASLRHGPPWLAGGPI